jgi:phospholipase C
MGNRELWESTSLFITYDEHDGYFDHVVPPAPEATDTDEFIGGLPIGFGTRVPMIICSPWTRGGYVDSNTYNHTSVLQFLETWTGVRAANVTDWRRTISGDLTAAFDFAHPDFSIPDLPDTVALINQSDAEMGFPGVSTPAEGKQVFPVQERGTRPHRPGSSRPHADAAVRRSSGLVTATMTNHGGKVGVSLAVYPDSHLPFTATPFTVTAAADRTYTWDTAATGGDYAFSIYGPDGFVRSFAGAVVPAGHDSGQVPAVTATLEPGVKPALAVHLANEGKEPVTYTLTPNDYAGRTQTVRLSGGGAKTVKWAANADGYYDVTVTANTSDGFTRRYAGRIG